LGIGANQSNRDTTANRKNDMTKHTFQLLGLAALLAATTSTARADLELFHEDFESGDLTQWTGKIDEPHSGVIVPDPLNPANQVLTFTQVAVVGDIFTAEKFDLSGPRRYILSFDFLGLPVGDAAPAEYGGFVGLTAEPTRTAEHYWVAGTAPDALNVAPEIATELIADGVWRRYEIDITDIVRTSGLTQIHLMLEDWLERESIPGDVFFDNIKLVGELDACEFDKLVPCCGPGVKWRNHGQYVVAMTRLVHDCLKAGLITRAEAKAVITTAARSNCGKVTCRKFTPPRIFKKVSKIYCPPGRSFEHWPRGAWWR